MHRSGLGVECAPSALVEGAHPESATETVADISPVHPDFAGLAPEGKGPRTILLVEDEALVRDVVDEILSSAGYRVLKARSAGEALRIFHGYQGKVELLLPTWYCRIATAMTWHQSLLCCARASERFLSPAILRTP